ncbi:MAG: hypothetical protein OEM01_07395 [Desulfobulbaceae bacterium]|nr:hypothetical protein [Desulfobulbaceae bacterium]
MKKSKLTWFDRLMVGVTFAEAGIEGPVLQSDTNKKDRQNAYSIEQEELYAPGHDSTIPAHS